MKTYQHGHSFDTLPISQAEFELWLEQSQPSFILGRSRGGWKVSGWSEDGYQIAYHGLSIWSIYLQFWTEDELEMLDLLCKQYPVESLPSVFNCKPLDLQQLTESSMQFRHEWQALAVKQVTNQQDKQP